MSTTYNLLLSRPLAQLRAAAVLAGVPAAATLDKAGLALALADRISNGYITLDQIKMTPWTGAAPTPAASSASDPALAAVVSRVEAASVSLAAEVARVLEETRAARKQADDAASMAGALAGRIDRVKDAAAADASTIRADMAAGLDRLARDRAVDPDKVAQEVQAAVAAAFRPFAQRVDSLGAQAVVGGMVQARVIARVPCSQAFGVDLRDAKGAPVEVDIFDHPDAPAVDPVYIWTPEMLRFMVAGSTMHCWLGGPKGTGKTEAARQFAARTGRAFERINFAKYTTPEDYLGAVGLDGSSGSTSTAFQPGPFLRAYSAPGTVVLLDEITNTDPGNLAPLNALLEPGAVCRIGGQAWSAGIGTFAVAADNTLGNGDQSGRYAGTRSMNASLLDRFGIVARTSYLPPEMEAEAVMRHTGCSKALADHVIGAITLCRSKVDSGEIIDPPSIRSAVAFVRACRLMPVLDAWSSTVAARQPAESAVGLLAVYTACVNPAIIAANL